MVDRPIIFSAPMVRALLDGRKTMTRRLAMRTKTVRQSGREFYMDVPGPWQKAKAGDRLWVRETAYVECAGYMDGTGKRILYRATEPEAPTTWTPAIHMYRFASRLTLVVTAVKVEKLQEITAEDAVLEGVWPAANSQTIDCDTPDPRHEFRALWESLHGDGDWDANPCVVALSFEVHRANIDALKVAA